MSSTAGASLFLLIYVLVLHLIPVTNMLGVGEAVPAAALQYVLAGGSMVIALAYVGERIATGGPRLTVLDGLIGLYISWSLFSFVFFMQRAHPVQPLAFGYGVHHLLLPVPLFFAAKYLGHEQRIRVLRLVCYLNIAMMVIGLLVFALRPAFYTNYLTSYYSGSRNLIPAELLYLRLGSYMGSTAIGLMGALTIVLAVLVRLPGWLMTLLPALMLVSVVLSQQRGGIAVIGPALVYFFLARQRTVTPRLVGAALLAVTLISGVVIIERIYPGLLGYTIARLGTLGEALGDRSGSYQIGWHNVTQHPLGLGLGAATPFAFNAGLFNYGEEVTDTNFLRILSDLGIPGFLAFVLILLAALWRANLVRGGMGWALLILMYVVIAFGTNVFDSYYMAHVFWLIVAAVDGLPEARQPGKERVPISRWQTSHA